MRRIFVILFSLSFHSVLAQSPIAMQPIAGDVDFAGTFGELRSHHFHSGVDIRTGGQTGWPVRAVQDGYLSRMVVRPDGFGWALYLRHPNGYTSVYAHLEDFKPEWHALLLQRAEAARSNRLDLYFSEGHYPVKAGDTIAWSGNSGGSAGPHLHFEWRDTRTEEPLNPFSFGMNYGDDSYPPKILALHTADGQKAVVSAGVWSQVLSVHSWQELSAEIRDKKHPQGLNLGIQALEVSWTWGDAQTQHGFEMDRFSFDDTRAADGLMQPKVHQRTGLRTYRLAPSLGPAPIWSDPAIPITRPGSYTVTITARAANGDVVQASGPVELLDGTGFPWADPELSGKVDLQSGRLVAEDFQVVWNRNSFTDPVVPTLTKVADRKWQAAPDVPVLKAVTCYWTPPADYPAEWRSKTVLIGRDPRGSYRIVGEPQSNGGIRFAIKLFGTFSITQDTEAPTFSSLRSGSFQGQPAWYISLKDNLLDVTDYQAFVNNAWTWAYYDAKNHRLYIPKQQHSGGTLRLTAEDEAGNRSTFESLLP